MDPHAALRNVLAQTDPTPATVQASSRAIMKHYDQSPTLAVNEWRNSIRTCKVAQLLPLLYVANEVLQTSKRNRGNKFLEAFSPVLGTSTQYLCERDGSIIEKVRRVIKIWGDRRVFSRRYVGELLNGIDSFRNNLNKKNEQQQTNNKKKKILSSSSPFIPKSPIAQASSHPRSTIASSMDSDDDDDDEFESATKKQRTSLLQVDVTTITQKNALSSTPSGITNKTKKAVNNNITSPNKLSSPRQPNVKKPKVYNTNTLLDLLKRTDGLSNEYNVSKSKVEGCPSLHFSTDQDEISDFVGDELVQMHDDVVRTSNLLAEQRKKMYSIAKERRELEAEAAKFLPFLKESLKQDEEELAFCTKVEERIKLLSVVIDAARAARDQKRQEEEERLKKAEAEKRRLEEEAQRKKSLESTMKEKIDQPGMVYNPATRGYQVVHDHTEDDWRN